MVIDSRQLLLELLAKDYFQQLDFKELLIMLGLYGWHRKDLPTIFPGEGFTETTMEELYEDTIEPKEGSKVIDYMSKLIDLSGRDITQLTEKQLKIRDGLNRWRLKDE